MKSNALAFLALATTALPAHGASPEFKVELFSNRIVKSISVEAPRQGIKACDPKFSSSCVELAPKTKISCLADRGLRCQLNLPEQTFTGIRLESPQAFRLMATFLKTNEPTSSVLLQNAQVNVHNGALQIVTRVDLGSYVSGVLRGEASVLQAGAARQAMAILARTWALRWSGRHSGQGFDFCSLTHCQVFAPRQGTADEAGDDLDSAARLTRGQVLQFHGALADPYFSACCGGMTEAAGNIWPDRSQPYLISVRDPYCAASPHNSWNKSLPAESVRQVLQDVLNLPAGGTLTELSVAKRDSSGRALTLHIVAGGSRTIDANQFRYAIDRSLGWGQIQSNLYVIQREGDTWTFSGHGLGHGVGLCQAGAEQMARLGVSTSKILMTYFPGTEIVSSFVDEDDPIAASEHFELIYPASQEPWVKQTLETLEQWQKEMAPHSAVLPGRMRVETWATTEEFIRATGQPGWMAGSSDGSAIALQPLALLSRKEILNQTLRHELTHLIVHRLRAKGVPRWFEEGCVLYLTGERVDAPSNLRTTTAALEAAITRPGSEAQMHEAYAQALKRVSQLAQNGGETALWRVLTHPGADDLQWFEK